MQLIAFKREVAQHKCKISQLVSYCYLTFAENSKSHEVASIVLLVELEQLTAFKSEAQHKCEIGQLVSHCCLTFAENSKSHEVG